jgi:glycyl-tRNA synthetase (class II)
MWNEFEIIRRENLIREIPCLLKMTWETLNRAVRMERCETPILTPAEKLQSHINTGFELINTTGNRGYLRPETTAGTFEFFNSKFDVNSIKKNLPYCMWQVGCSFRDEKNEDTMRASKLRLVQFYQMEFQLFTSSDTKAPYIETALDALIKVYGGEFKEADELPHYSEKTLDWYINDLEVAGCSIRKDWSHGKVFEIAIGLDRLVALQLLK